MDDAVCLAPRRDRDGMTLCTLLPAYCAFSLLFAPQKCHCKSSSLSPTGRVFPGQLRPSGCDLLKIIHEIVEQRPTTEQRPSSIASAVRILLGWLAIGISKVIEQAPL